MKCVRLVFLMLVLLVAAHGVEATFRAADLVVVPVAADIGGIAGSYWQTDLEILNVDLVPIDVMIVFLASGGSSNFAWYADIANHLGGRTEDGFGHVDARLMNIQPKASVVFQNVVSTWGAGEKGALLIFAYEAGTLMKTTPPGGNPKRIVVNTRTYTVGTAADGTTTLTYGQGVPGLPWYDYIAPNLKSRSLDHVVFTGLEENASYRVAIGLVNISDPLTTINVELILRNPDGTQLADYGLSLAPLAHEQYDHALNSFFGLSESTAYSGLSLVIAAQSFQSSGSNATATPAMLAYVSKIDNNTNDPSFYEQTYDQELPWDCVFNGNCPSIMGAAVKSQGAALPSHLRPPARLRARN